MSEIVGGGSKVRIGVVGAGFMSQVAHLPSLCSLPLVSVVGVADNCDALGPAVAQRFDIAHYSDFGELIHRPDLEAVLISLPRRAMGPAVLRALEAGKAVLAEKPMAFSSADGRRLVSAAQRSGKTYAIGYMRRHDRGLRLFKDILQQYCASTDLGPILHVDVQDFCATYSVAIPAHLPARGARSSRYPEWPVLHASLPEAYARDYEFTHNVACHDINLVRWLFGKPLAPAVFQVHSGGTQTAILNAGGYDVVLRVGPVDTGAWHQRISVYFRKGLLSAYLPSPLLRQEITTVKLARQGRVEHLSLPPDQRIWAFQAQAEHFVDAVRGAAPVEASGTDSLGDLELIEELWEKVAWHA